MTETYKIMGMTCGGCETEVKKSLLKLPNVSEVEVSKEKQTATISMDERILLATFQNVLDKKYSITILEHTETLFSVICNHFLTHIKAILR